MLIPYVLLLCNVVYGCAKNQDDGQFQVVWKTEGLVVGDAWSNYLPDSKDLIADWRPPLSCGNYNVKTKACSGQNY